MNEPDRYFALLLKLLPTSFRARHGKELLALLIQMKNDLGRTPSRLALLRLYLAVTWDLLWQSPLSRSERSPGAPPPSTRVSSSSWTVWGDILRQSLVSTARTTRRYPAFTAGVVITLGLGIGANAAMYASVDRLLLQPPAHIEDHERVQRVFIETLSYFGTGEQVLRPYLSYPDYEALQSHSGLSAVGMYNPVWEHTIGSGADAGQVQASEATAEFFTLLGVSPVIGRFYTPEESGPGSPLTIVLSEEYWRSAYGADPDVLGRPIEVFGRDHTIIGVAPRGFTGIDLAKVDLWIPLEASYAATNPARFTRRSGAGSAVIRLKDGVSIEAAQAEATRLVMNGWRDVPEVVRGRPVGLTLWSLIAARGPDADFDPGRGLEATAESRVALWLMGVSAIVLLIACANVANLFMARSTRQRREVAVRIALGASRGRVVGQMMVESVLLALAGGVLALLFALFGSDIARSALLPDVYFPDSAVTMRLLVFTALASVVAGVAAGVVPALQGSRLGISGGLSEGARGTSARRSKLRAGLTVAQTAMSVVLLVGAGLFLRSLGEARSRDLGLDIDRLLLARLDTRDSGLGADEQAALYEEAIMRVSELPGVRSASATDWYFQNAQGNRPFTLPGVESIPLEAGGAVHSSQVTPGYFETVGLEITRGRPFEASDRTGGASVTVVSETMASVLWPDRDALGECILLFDQRRRVPGRDCTTVVGVAQDAARDGFQDVPGLTYYLPLPSNGFPRALYVRAEADAEGILAEVATLLRSYSPLVRYADVQTLGAMLDSEARAWTLGATILTLFGLLALSLAAIGLYSLLAFDVAQCTRELGIRSALGATRSRLLGGVLLHGAGLTASGVALGLCVAFLIAPYLGELLFQVSARDPRVLASVALVLLAVGVFASLVPGLRATAADPTEALRA